MMLIETEEEYYPRQDTSIHEDAAIYQATTYEQLRAMVEYLPLTADDVFVDYGCGKGRVLCYMALQNIRKVVGVELRQELIDIAWKNIRALKPQMPVEIYKADAARFSSPDGTLFYLFNPFGSRTVKDVVGAIERSVKENPRLIRIIYNNTVYRYHLDMADWLVKEGPIGHSGLWVWKSDLSRLP